MKAALREGSVYRPVLGAIAEYRVPGCVSAVVLAPLLSSALGGCAVRGAPSFVVAGSYFPGWMFCVLLGIVAAIAVRGGFVASGLAGVLPFQLFVCSAIGLCCGLLSWLLWFGQ